MLSTCKDSRLQIGDLYQCTRPPAQWICNTRIQETTWSSMTGMFAVMRHMHVYGLKWVISPFAHRTDELHVYCVTCILWFPLPHITMGQWNMPMKTCHWSTIFKSPIFHRTMIVQKTTNIRLFELLFTHSDHLIFVRIFREIPEFEVSTYPKILKMSPTHQSNHIPSQGTSRFERKILWILWLDTYSCIHIKPSTMISYGFSRQASSIVQL